MNLTERITIEPGKCGGRPCIRGLRIRVKDILSLLAAGASHQEILEDYPDLEEADRNRVMMERGLDFARAAENIFGPPLHRR